MTDNTRPHKNGLFKKTGEKCGLAGNPTDNGNEAITKRMGLANELKKAKDDAIKDSKIDVLLSDGKINPLITDINDLRSRVNRLGPNDPKTELDAWDADYEAVYREFCAAAPGYGGCPEDKPSKWTSNDPHVAEVANAIEDAYPGHVKGVNVEIEGHEVDILLDNAIIEVKSGNGKGLTKQIEDRIGLGLTVIGYAPQLGPSTARSIVEAGGVPAGGNQGSLDDLVKLVAPDVE